MVQPEPAPQEAGGRFAALGLIAVALLLAMSLWFSGSAVAPQIAAEWRLDPGAVSWLTLSVQLGFVFGTLGSALLNLPDVIRPTRLMTLAAIGGAFVNLAFALLATTLSQAVALRFVTGIALAGVYPPGMKLIATWFRQGRGLALGVLIGALTLGKASPYLVNAIGSSSWRVNVASASVLALCGAALIFWLVREGPFALPNQPFDLAQVGAIFRNRGVRLASLGYYGHMWELYAMWTWAPAMIRASVELTGGEPWVYELASFILIGSGAVGCVVAGALADRFGRTLVASAAMAVSAACCLAVGPVFGRSWIGLLIIVVIWGATVVADSAQFSACVTELGDPRYIGTALTMQTCIGFLITTISIRLMPELVARAGWGMSFGVLAVGPLLGIVAMLKLRTLPEAARLANGRR